MVEISDALSLFDPRGSINAPWIRLTNGATISSEGSASDVARLTRGTDNVRPT